MMLMKNLMHQGKIVPFKIMVKLLLTDEQHKGNGDLVSQVCGNTWALSFNGSPRSNEQLGHNMEGSIAVWTTVINHPWNMHVLFCFCREEDNGPAPSIFGDLITNKY
jgi:hypothetical protein